MNSNQFLRFYNKFGVFFILLIECVIFALGSPNFLKVDNMLIIGRQVSMIGISSIGMTCVILLGGIDISVGAIMALSGVLCVKMMSDFGWPLGLAILLVLAIGTVIGLCIGLLWTKFNVPPLISSLAFQTLVNGIAYVITGGIAIRVSNEFFKEIGQGHVFGALPIPLVIMVVFMIIGYWVLEKTYMGRYIYAVGGNKESARLSGIKADLVVILVFCVSGFLAACSGVINAARMNSGNPSVGTDFAMNCITAVVLGGVNVNGGEGRFVNVIAGVFIMGLLSNGLVLMGIDEYYQWIIKGVVLITAVVLSNLRSSSVMKAS